MLKQNNNKNDEFFKTSDGFSALGVFAPKQYHYKLKFTLMAPCPRSRKQTKVPIVPEDVVTALGNTKNQITFVIKQRISIHFKPKTKAHRVAILIAANIFLFI